MVELRVRAVRGDRCERARSRAAAPIVAAFALACTLDNPAWDPPMGHSGGGTGTTTAAATTDPSPADWWDPAWRVRRPLTIHNPTDAALDDAPVALLLTPARFDYSAAAVDGRDLRVVASDGAQLDLEIERWAADAASTLWVRAPALPPGDTAVWLYWGNPDAAAAPVGDLWRAYAAVYHLADALADDLRIRDARGDHDGHAYPTMGPASATLGPLGGALRFAGADLLDPLVGDLVVVDDAPVDSDPWPGLTLEAWVRHGAPGEHRIVCRSPSILREAHVFALGVHAPDGKTDGTDLYLRLGVDDTDAREYITALGAITAGADAAWHHVAATWDGARVRVFVDGVIAPIREGYASDTYADSFDQAGATLRDDPSPLTLANVNDTLASLDDVRFWIGELDELRLAAVGRSPAWIRVQHLSMTDQLVDYSAADEALDP
ncbi:MAG: DUF2341 domain-containing protein [Nannocystaceae bacterium]